MFMPRNGQYTLNEIISLGNVVELIEEIISGKTDRKTVRRLEEAVKKWTIYGKPLGQAYETSQA
jgi:hypothetical protein